MNKMKKVAKSFPFNIVIIVTFFGFISAYSLLQPRVSGIYPFIRQYRLNTILKNIKESGSVPTQEFWKFREYYFPGLIAIDKRGIKDNTALPIDAKLNPLLFFQFKSKYIISNEYLISSNDLSLILPPTANSNWHINKSKSYAYIEDGSGVEIVFVKPISELVKANGFIYEKDEDKKRVEGKYWLVVTTIHR